MTDLALGYFAVNGVMVLAIAIALCYDFWVS